MAAAVVGGAAAKAAGGNFENGAVSAAFAHLFNNALSEKSATAGSNHYESDDLPPGILLIGGDVRAQDAGYAFLTVNEVRVLEHFGIDAYAYDSQLDAIDSLYPETVFIPALKLGRLGWSAAGSATGGMKQWIRIGKSYDKVNRVKTWGIRWGASPRYAHKIGNPTIRKFNQWLRKQGPGEGGHLHLRRYR